MLDMRNFIIAPVSLSNIEAVYPNTLRSLFWEDGPSRTPHGLLRHDQPRGEPQEGKGAVDASEPVSEQFLEDYAAFEKESWLNTVIMTWGQCGFSLLRAHDNRPVATILFAPPRFCPTTFAMPSGPISPDAVAITSLHADPIEVDINAQVALIENALKHLAARGIHAVEAFGCSGNADEEPTVPAKLIDLDDHRVFTTELLDELVNAVDPKPCYSNALGAINHEVGDVIKTSTLLKAGLKVVTPHPIHPKLRMELNAELDWNEAVGRALDRHVAGQYLSARKHGGIDFDQSSFSASKS